MNAASTSVINRKPITRKIAASVTVAGSSVKVMLKIANLH
jgi:hypothetical protein